MNPINLFKILFFCLTVTGIFSIHCNPTAKNPEQVKTTLKKPMEIQGHRGCRGLYPENTIPAFLKAVELGVNTLEMDVVISKDKKVVVSHDPWLSSEICKDMDGKHISPDQEKTFKLHAMEYSEIQKCDCGSKPHPRFPTQKKLFTYKPLLSEVIDSVENFIREKNLPEVKYNIETKTTPEGDNIYHPEPEEFVKFLMDIIKEKKITNLVIIQSFDRRTLQLLKNKFPGVPLSLLVENNVSPEENIQSLGFYPEIYSPDYILVNAELISWGQKLNMKIIPWTVNEERDMRKLILWGVDGIITDYPDRALKVLGNDR